MLFHEKLEWLLFLNVSVDTKSVQGNSSLLVLFVILNVFLMLIPLWKISTKNQILDIVHSYLYNVNIMNIYLSDYHQNIFHDSFIGHRY